MVDGAVDLAALLRQRVPDGATVGIGGAGLSRKPMALLRALVRSGVADLTVVSFLGGLDVELLLATGVVSDLHTAGVDLGGFGLAPAYRTARQDSTIVFHEWSEGSLVAALEAAARGLPSMPTDMSPRSDVVEVNDLLGAHPDPMTGELVTYARALSIDVALLHVPSIDAVGNAYIDGDVGIDGVLARAAALTIASAEETTTAPQRTAAISRLWIDRSMLIANGSWPTACHPHALVDLNAVSAWSGGSGEDASLLEPAR